MLGGGFLHLDAVLVGPGKEVDGLAKELLDARDDVGPDDFDVFDVLGLGDAVKSNNADGSSDQDSSVGSDA